MDDVDIDGPDERELLIDNVKPGFIRLTLHDIVRGGEEEQVTTEELFFIKDGRYGIDKINALRSDYGGLDDGEHHVTEIVRGACLYEGDQACGVVQVEGQQGRLGKYFWGKKKTGVNRRLHEKISRDTGHDLRKSSATHSMWGV